MKTDIHLQLIREAADAWSNPRIMELCGDE